VPKKNAVVRKAAKGSKILWLTPRIRLGVGIDYPNPKTIGRDRLANARRLLRFVVSGDRG